jgi:hypothetical protein
MWHRDRVFWGKGSKRGLLQGRKSGREIDFRDQVGVYVLYDEARRPIYVGQAGQGNARLFVRLRTHTRDHLASRWSYFSWFGFLQINKNGRLSKWDYPDKRVHGTLRTALNEIEGVMIAATEPASNRQGASFKGIPQYRQVPHSEADDVSTRELRNLIRSLPEQVSTSVAITVKKLLKPK